jgi:nitric oxide reductase NorE protein
MYYFVLTGLHLLHYFGGMVALLVTLVRTRMHGLNAGYTRWIESVGVYWHMVDIIWIFLFPMLYMLRVA